MVVMVSRYSDSYESSLSLLLASVTVICKFCGHYSYNPETSPNTELAAGIDRHLRCTSQHELYVSRPAGGPDIFALEVVRVKLGYQKKHPITV